jgi:hypothetical protein
VLISMVWSWFIERYLFFYKKTAVTNIEYQ